MKKIKIGWQKDFTWKHIALAWGMLGLDIPRITKEKPVYKHKKVKITIEEIKK